MSPLERLDWLRHVRDAGATLSAVSVAVEVAFRDSGDGAWGSLGGVAIGERAARDGRAWLVAHGFLRRIHRAWRVQFPSGTVMPESGIVMPGGNSHAGIRHDGAGLEERHGDAIIRNDGAGLGSPHAPPPGTVVPPERHHDAEKAAPWCHRTGKEQGYNLGAPPPSPSVAQPSSDPSAATTANLHPGEIARRLAARVEDQIDLRRIRNAILDGSPLDLLGAFGANMHRDHTEWLRDAGGMQIGVLAAVLLWRRELCTPVREPSGLRQARAAWNELPPTVKHEWKSEIEQILVTSPGEPSP